MEGRPFRRAGTGGTFDDRVDRLVDSAREAELRDRAIPYATTVLALGVTLLAFAYLFRARLPSRVRRALPTAAVAVLALASRDVRERTRVGPERVGARGFDPRSRGRAHRRARGAASPASVLRGRVSRWRSSWPCSRSTSLSGARLQLNTLFGYSTAVAGRFAGVGNLAFGFLAAATLLLAVTVWEAFPDVAGCTSPIAILTVGVLLDGLPMLGGDVGGVLAMVPAFGLDGNGPRGAAGAACGTWSPGARRRRDGARVRPASIWRGPRDERTHLARFIERVSRSSVPTRSRRLFERRWEASIGSPRTAMLLIVALGRRVRRSSSPSCGCPPDEDRVVAPRGPSRARRPGVAGRDRARVERLGDRGARSDARSRGARRRAALGRRWLTGATRSEPMSILLAIVVGALVGRVPAVRVVRRAGVAAAGSRELPRPAPADRRRARHRARRRRRRGRSGRGGCARARRRVAVAGARAGARSR